MRIEQAASYLSISVSSFQQLIEDGELPKATRILRGIALWDRYDLDAAFEGWKDQTPENSFDSLLENYDKPKAKRSRLPVPEKREG